MILMKIYYERGSSNLLVDKIHSVVALRISVIFFFIKCPEI